MNLRRTRCTSRETRGRQCKWIWLKSCSVVSSDDDDDGYITANGAGARAAVDKRDSAFLSSPVRRFFSSLCQGSFGKGTFRIDHNIQRPRRERRYSAGGKWISE